MGRCGHCGRRARSISGAVGYCADCIRERFEEVWPRIKAVHDRSREADGLPTGPPRAPEGLQCPLCMHACRIPEGGSGYCGVRQAEGGRIIGGRPHEGSLSFYHDPLPTNCVADFVCPGGTGCGYPRFSVSRGPEYGHKNLAVFYRACSFNCLFCQNHHHREGVGASRPLPATTLAAAADNETTCICHFGGDPAPQILHALKASRLAVEKASGRVLRICWETNGAVSEPFLKRMAELSLGSGGCIKVDLKAWDSGIHRALCGVDNRHTLKTVETLSRWATTRPDPPFLVVSSLLVPGYVDAQEVGPMAAFLASLDPQIPYSLLAFHPQFHLRDLPTTSRSHALRCKEAAERAGLRRVRIGNVHLLGRDY